MAGQDDLEFKILANDEASAVVDKVQAKAEALEKLDPSVDISADSAKAETTVKSLAERIEGLTDKQKDIVLKATVAQAEEDIKRLERGLRGFRDLSDEEIQIRLTALDKATDDLEGARQLRDQLSAKPAEVEITADDKASGDLDRVGDQARDLDAQDVDIDVSATGLDGVLGKVGELDGAIGQLAGGLSTLSAGGGIAAGAAAIAAGLGAAAVSASDAAISAQSLATLTGDSVEDASRLQQVWKLSGADVQDLADVALQVQGALAQTPALAQQLGIDIHDGATGGQRLAQVLEKVRDYSGSAADKAQLMSQVFGEEGARQAAALLSIVQDIPEALDDVNPDLIISDEQVAQAREFKANVAELTAEFQSVAMEIGQNVIPLASDLLGILGDIAGIKIDGQGIFDIGGYNAFKAAIESDDITPKFNEQAMDGWRAFLQGAQADTQAAQAATDGFNSVIDELARQMGEAEQATIDAEKAVKDYQDTLRAAADSTFAVQRANEEWTLTVTETEAKADDLRKTIAESTAGSVENVKATNDLNELYRKGAENAADFADAERQWAVDQAAANGETLSAVEAMEVWNRKMVDTAASASGPLRQSIIDYIAASNGIDPQKVTDIINRYGELTPDQIIAELNAVGAGSYGATIDVTVDPALANAKKQLDDIDGRTVRTNIVVGTTVIAGQQGINNRGSYGGGYYTPGSSGEVGELGRPETFRGPDGRLYLIAPDGGQVIPIAGASASGGVTNVYLAGMSSRRAVRTYGAGVRRGFSTRTAIR